MSVFTRSFRFPISPLEAIVLIRNVMDCPDAENDADRTVEELCREIDAFDGYLSKGVLESALYCCNMNQENQTKVPGLKFWHPSGRTFDQFVKELLPTTKAFNKYYHFIYEREEDEK